MEDEIAPQLEKTEWSGIMEEEMTTELPVATAAAASDADDADKERLLSDSESRLLEIIT